MEDITKTTFYAMRDALREAEERADALMMEADTDQLTGILNRRGLKRRTQSREWGWFVAVDLNNFKRAQDDHRDGHAYGDRILREFSEYLVNNIRAGDMKARDILVARTGGDEFALWCETRVGARRIRDMIRAWSSGDGRVSASAGLGKDPEAADSAMYMNKQETSK